MKDKLLNISKAFFLFAMVVCFSVMFAGSVDAVPPPPTFEIAYTDGDADNVYFEGNTISFTVSIENNLLPSPLMINLGVVTDSVTPILDTTTPVLNEQVVSHHSRLDYYATNTTDGTYSVFTVTGTITATPLETGIIGFQIYDGNGLEILGLSSQVFIVNDNLDGNPSCSNKGCALVGVKMPDGIDVTASPALSSFDNLYNTEKEIEFIKNGKGSIEFDIGLNIIGNREELSSLEAGIEIVTGEEDNYVFVSTAILSFLEGKGASVEVLGIGEGEWAVFPDTSDGFASNVDVADGNLTFDATQFSRYNMYQAATVTFTESNELLGFTIEIYYEGDSKKLYEETAGAGDNYALVNVKTTQTYDFIAKKSGYNDFTGSFEVTSADKEVIFAMTATPPPPSGGGPIRFPSSGSQESGDDAEEDDDDEEEKGKEYYEEKEEGAKKRVDFLKEEKERADRMKNLITTLLDKAEGEVEEKILEILSKIEELEEQINEELEEKEEELEEAKKKRENIERVERIKKTEEDLRDLFEKFKEENKDDEEKIREAEEMLEKIRGAIEKLESSL